MGSAMEAQGNFVVCDGDVGRHINARLARRLQVGLPRYRPRKIGRCELAIGTTTSSFVASAGVKQAPATNADYRLRPYRDSTAPTIRNMLSGGSRRTVRPRFANPDEGGIEESNREEPAAADPASVRARTKSGTRDPEVIPISSQRVDSRLPPIFQSTAARYGSSGGCANVKSR
jgi:hypothetical protein